MNTADEILNETGPAISAGHISPDLESKTASPAMTGLARLATAIAGLCILAALIAGLIAFLAVRTTTDMPPHATAPLPKVLPIP